MRMTHISPHPTSSGVPKGRSSAHELRRRRPLAPVPPLNVYIHTTWFDILMCSSIFTRIWQDTDVRLPSRPGPGKSARPRCDMSALPEKGERKLFSGPENSLAGSRCWTASCIRVNFNVEIFPSFNNLESKIQFCMFHIEGLYESYLECFYRQW